FAQFMQMRTPFAVMREVLRYALGQKNVPGAATIHYALGNIDSGAGHVRPLVHVVDAVDRSAVQTHAQGNLRVQLQRLGDLHSALHRVLWMGEENEDHAVAGRNTKE